MLALALWIFFDMRKGFIRDFAAALSCLSALSAILDSVLLFLLCALELGGYYLWRRRAKREAELEDSCRRAHILCYRCWRSWRW